jgi:FkbM family methyltransferase
MPYSQNDEEQVILKLAEVAGLKSGRFLDIGAYDGKTFSNSLRLVELGWSGICIEPSPTAFTGLLKIHAEHPEVILVIAAVGIEDEWLEFYDSGGDAVSSSSQNHVMRWMQNAGVKFTKFSLRAISIKSLFAKFGMGFDFINLDVEGLNWTLFKAMPWQALSERTKIICIEYDSYYREMTELMEQHGYEMAHRTAENLIFSRNKPAV